MFLFFRGISFLPAFLTTSLVKSLICQLQVSNFPTDLRCFLVFSPNHSVLEDHPINESNQCFKK